MIYEKFDLEDDSSAAEYNKEFDFFITYHLQALYDEEDFIRTNKHEWLHALFEWATDDKVTVEQEHWMLRKLGWDYGL